ncbi:enoyl-CoA hydratase [Polymorphobacter multimanifer]|uniref:Enoyl-CoA hydratase/carnithine racemase n=1 Tax=Polymorphobacter multimanifer TaxID=1070431 RepID=A0A841KZM4_9SPHN|nr:enoyl-CoA hydratase-related protein [Polymorphobacter multimanifer]MBB6226009.1 enoyl-CoA hydratase/carnithine racemase [Polymorphobacter multimanifer]GGI84293.1 enoyl-CoA hydratase [Polymorphobacter multimanifer]
MTDHPHLRLETAGPVARLLLDRPAKRNAMEQSMWEALPGLVARAMADPAVRLLIVASAHPGPFCAGADIAEFAVHSADPAWRARNAAAIRATQVSLARAPKPTLAVIDGDAVGGGCGVAMACDLRIASPRARLGITPAKLGLVYPLHDTRLLVELVGPAQARRLLFSGALVDAAEALRIGLVQIVAQDLDAEVTAFAAAVTAASPSSQRASKAIIQRIIEGAHDDDAESQAGFDAAFTGPDFAEGVAAFLAKRKPDFGASA